MPSPTDSQPEARRLRPSRSGVQTSLRTAQVWEAVSALVAAGEQRRGRPLRILDLGGGTGGLAVALAGLGHHVTVVDPSPDALAALDRRAQDTGVAGRVHGVQGDAANLTEVHRRADIDLVCCHGVLEVVDDPHESLVAIASVLDDGGQLSLVVAQRLAAVLARALAGQLDQARHALDSEDGRWGDGDPLPRRFDLHGVSALVDSAGLEVVTAHGVRVFADLVPAALVDSEADRSALLALERAVAAHPELGVLTQIGTALHVVAARR